MNRRRFVAGFGTAIALRAAQNPPVRITRITLAPIEGRFHKFVAMNSYDTAPKGHTYTNILVRVATDQGVEGVGVAAGNPSGAPLRELIGANPLDLYEMSAGRVTGRAAAHAALLGKLMWLDGPLFDLIGKLTNKPAWKLMGDSARDAVEVYDGTLYFSDVWFRDRGVRAVLEEAEEAVKFGYRGIKIKTGRGSKWMERDAGLQRDIDVLNAARKAVGPGIKILTDPNNGYRNDFDRAWKLMAGTAAARLHWMEEIFPEDIDEYTRLREKMSAAGLETLIADGESATYPDDLLPFLKPRRLIDVLQLDIRKSGLVGNLEMARIGAAAGALTVPHNWASHVGMLMGLQIAKANPHIPAAEDDRSTCDVIDSSAYRFQNGSYRVPDSPGLAIRVDEKVYAAKYRSKETVVS